MSSTVLVESFKCQKCTGYLSHFPIFLLKNGGFICVCCYKPDDVDIVGRNEALEKMIENLEFPCCNKKTGCKELFRPAEIKIHEKNCVFVGNSCLISGCEWKGTFTDLLNQHFNEAHEDYVVKNKKFELDFTTAKFEKHYLYIDDENGVFLIRLSFVAPQLKCEFKDASGDVKSFICFLMLSSVHKPEPVIISSGCTLEIHQNFMIASVEVCPILKKFVDQNLSCFYCAKALEEGENNTCLKGHITCKNCQDTHLKNCTKTLQENDSLGKALAMRFPCKFKVWGCQFSDTNMGFLKAHELSCAYLTSFCGNIFEEIWQRELSSVFIQKSAKYPFDLIVGKDKHWILFEDGICIKLHLFNLQVEPRQHGSAEVGFDIELITNASVQIQYQMQLSINGLNESKFISFTTEVTNSNQKGCLFKVHGRKYCKFTTTCPKDVYFVVQLYKRKQS